MISYTAKTKTAVDVLGVVPFDPEETSASLGSIAGYPD
jgi:hypothetical protein